MSGAAPGPSQFDAYLAYFANMGTDELIQFLSDSVPMAGLSDSSSAFLQAFAQRILDERQAREAAQNQQQSYTAYVSHLEQVAQDLQRQLNEANQAQAAQAAGLGAAGQPPNAPPQATPHMSTSQGNQQPMNYQNQMQNSATLGGQSRLGQALFKGIKPPTFDGSKVIDFIFKVNQYLDAVDENASDSDKIRFTTNLLTGKALTWWRYRHTYSHVTYPNFNAFTDDLYQHFVDTDHVNKLRDQLDNLVQNRGQNVQKYIAKFKELQIELGPYSLTDDQALYKFVKGLQTNIRVFTNMSRPSSFADACQSAVAAEQALQGTLGTNMRSTGGHGTSDKMDLGMFTQTTKQRTTNQHRPNNNNNRRNTHQTNNAHKGKAPVRTGDSWKKSATCNFCGKTGHIKPECYSFLRSQGRPTGNGGAKPPYRASANLAEQVAQLSAELAALKATRPSSSKN